MGRPGGVDSSGCFHASNGLMLLRGGYLPPEHRDADIALQVAARKEAREAGFDVSFAAQTAHASKPTPPKALVRKTLSEWLDAAPAAPRFAVDMLVPARVVTLMGGNGGTGKSIIGGIIAAHAGAGQPVFGHAVTQCRVLFVSLEDPADMVARRIFNVIAAYGLDQAAVEQNLTVVAPPEGADTVMATEDTLLGTRRMLQTAVYEEALLQAAGCGLVIIDNASDAYDGNENDRRQVRGFIRLLQDIAQANDAGLILLAHIDKNAAKFGGAGNTYSGSTAWHNSARSRLVVTEKQGIVELSQEKLNLGRKLDQPILLRWSTEHHTFMPADDVGGTPMSTGDAEAVLAAIRLAASRGAEVRAARTGPATTHKILETYDLPAHLRGNRGRDAFWSAIGALHASNRITEVDARTASRHPCRLLVEVGAPVSCAAQYPTPRYAEPAQPAQLAQGPAGVANSREPARTRATRAKGKSPAEEYMGAASGE